jgi:ABC-type transport system involved in cytochrome bd biosynthesis fused ATPase/permease subunit
LEVRPGQKVAICGEVGSGKSTLLAAILREVPTTQGKVRFYSFFFSYINFFILSLVINLMAFPFSTCSILSLSM